MEYASIVLKQTVIMFLIICVGILCYKKSIITKEAGKYLSGFVLNIVTPMYIIMSYQTDITTELMRGLVMAFILSFLSHILLITISKVIVRKNEKYEYIIDEFSVIYVNCGYMGIPLIQGVFGNEGVLYITAYVTMMNIFVWTHGVILMKNSFSKEEVIKVLKSPTIIAIAIGLICFVAKIKIPELIASPLNYVGSMNTPLAMIVAGITIGQTNIKETVKNLRVLTISVLRLMVVPAIIIPILSLIPCDKVAFTTIMLAVSCPVATVGTLFAVNYDKNAVYAAELFATSTVLSAITLPLMILYTGLFS